MQQKCWQGNSRTALAGYDWASNHSIGTGAIISNQEDIGWNNGPLLLLLNWSVLIPLLIAAKDAKAQWSEKDCCLPLYEAFLWASRARDSWLNGFGRSRLGCAILNMELANAFYVQKYLINYWFLSLKHSGRVQKTSFYELINRIMKD